MGRLCGAQTNMRELDWGSPFVNYEPTHGWWFICKSVRSRAGILRLVCCVLIAGSRTLAHFRIGIAPFIFGVDDSVPRNCIRTGHNGQHCIPLRSPLSRELKESYTCFPSCSDPGDDDHKFQEANPIRSRYKVHIALIYLTTKTPEDAS